MMKIRKMKMRKTCYQSHKMIAKNQNIDQKVVRRQNIYARCNQGQTEFFDKILAIKFCNVYSESNGFTK